MLMIRVKVLNAAGDVIERHEIDHDDDGDRRWLALLCRRAFEDGRAVITASPEHGAVQD